MTTTDRSRLPLAFALILATATLSCYTLFQHPRLARLNYARPSGRPCADCHSPAELRTFVREERTRPATGAWASYYNDPWWLHAPPAGSDSTPAGKSDGAPR